MHLPGTHSLCGSQSSASPATADIWNFELQSWLPRWVLRHVGTSRVQLLHVCSVDPSLRTCVSSYSCGGGGNDDSDVKDETKMTVPCVLEVSKMHLMAMIMLLMQWDLAFVF